jgi:hypothetical protein
MQDYVSEHLRISVYESVYDSVYKSARYSVYNSVCDSVWDPTWIFVRNSVSQKLQEYEFIE